MNRALLRFASIAAPVALTACAGLLGLKPRGTERPFPHRAHVVAGTSCLACHAGITSAGDTGPLHLPSTATCRGCHAKPHDERECLGCHGELHERQRAELSKEHLKFDHARHVGVAPRTPRLRPGAHHRPSSRRVQVAARGGVAQRSGPLHDVPLRADVPRLPRARARGGRRGPARGRRRQPEPAPAGLALAGARRRRPRPLGAARSGGVRVVPRRRRRAALHRLPSRRRPRRQPARRGLLEREGQDARPAVSALPPGRP